MFDLAWSEIALIGVVALVVIGPKDLPEAIRGLARECRSCAAWPVSSRARPTSWCGRRDLEEVRSSINEIRNFNIRDTLEKAVDTDGTIRKTFTEDPLKTDYTSPYTAPASTGAATSRRRAGRRGPAAAHAGLHPAPAYAPAAPPIAPSVAAPSPVAAAGPPAPPAFVPPAEAPAPTQKS
ncbi:twin-arginine translocase TatA/TatE family subunit [Dankookia sp. P2]|uniref:twin-arginine translocase TatA/TatE family subunit n=1 Tax=Dankookia sp. P2 TaxID=3423955 RepID=UPI003D67FD02